MYKYIKYFDGFLLLPPALSLSHKEGAFPSCVKCPDLCPVIFILFFPPGKMRSVLLDGEKWHFPGGRSRRNVEMFSWYGDKVRDTP